MSSTDTEIERAGLSGLATSLIKVWAMLGGIVLLCVVAVNVFSVLGGIFWKPFPGDFEMTEVGVAVAAFAFLPYCQLTGSNVSADIFTSGASPKTVAFLTLLGSIIAFFFSLLLMWRMYDGMLDQKAYNYITAILQFPHWIAYIPILISLALLAVASFLSARENIAQLRKA